MATYHYANEAEPPQFRSTDHRGPPPPSTPYLTKKLLTMVTSSEKRQPRSSPASPADSIAEAMKNDLEELVGYIDNLAFDHANETANIAEAARTPAMNKQLFSGEDHPPFASRPRERTSGGKNVFRDRTNRFGATTSQATTGNKLGGSLKVVGTALEDRSSSSVRLVASVAEQPITADPVGTPLTRQEPAGSPPPQEASLYFHDESLSLILSDSEDTNDGIFDRSRPESEAPKRGRCTKDTERSPRLLSALQHDGFVSTPTRAKTISFRAVSKDPTPSKPAPSTSVLDTMGNGTLDSLRESSNIFDSEESPSDPFSAARHSDLKARRGTPHPRRVFDRLGRESLDRKGNEWWRARPVPAENTAARSISFLPDAKDDEFAAEENGSKSLHWGADVTTPLPHRRDTVKGTPHPFGRRSDSSDADEHLGENDNYMQKSGLQRTVPETPLANPNTLKNLVLTSPESARKLLKEAITALKEAREERDAAREWASNTKESVLKWAENQRQLIRTESALSNSTPISSEFAQQQQYQTFETLIDNLRSEIEASKSSTEAQLETMRLKQDVKIQELSRQLSDVKDKLYRSTEGKEIAGCNECKQSQKTTKYTNVDAPGSIHKTPQNNTAGLTRTASRSERSSGSSRGSHRTRRATPNGGHLIDYGNGVTKEIHPDGTTVTRFKNGDVETRFPPNSSTASSPSASAMMAYYHCTEEVLKITLRDGSVLYEYATGQVERHCASGVKIIRFPDGTKTIV
ncbi:unnamed protein product [Pseudo-nitzschia multistriata]|uniref:Centromere protein J C-terminal domain-containing protein n=1 Tax=Pseudo-nitzschia multistriata TaxID=183589 RepID=A0A448Z626_9STRA|nr:unnamed protein product [Pseudo-nitzschia multistriata]